MIGMSSNISDSYRRGTNFGSKAADNKNKDCKNTAEGYKSVDLVKRMLREAQQTTEYYDNFNPTTIKYYHGGTLTIHGDKEFVDRVKQDGALYCASNEDVYVYPTQKDKKGFSISFTKETNELKRLKREKRKYQDKIRSLSADSNLSGEEIKNQTLKIKLTLKYIENGINTETAKSRKKTIRFM